MPFHAFRSGKRNSTYLPLISLEISRLRISLVYSCCVLQGNSADELDDRAGKRRHARAVLGTGHVVIVPAAFTWALTARIGRQRSVFGGAVRAYLPGFAEDVSPYGHRLVLAEHISNPEDVAQCTRWMRSLAASESIRRTRLGYDVVSFGTVRNATLELKQQQLEHEGASDSQKLEAATARIQALEADLKSVKDSEIFLLDEASAGGGAGASCGGPTRRSNIPRPTAFGAI